MFRLFIYYIHFRPILFQNKKTCIRNSISFKAADTSAIRRMVCISEQAGGRKPLKGTKICTEKHEIGNKKAIVKLVILKEQRD
ncbi:MAG TPA: hypothetical protein DHV55_13845 [Clostridiaceae bacterium]|nr:hypothetical protein [Clostridiaceae bacterium]